jgi:hypothetical protein
MKILFYDLFFSPEKLFLAQGKKLVPHENIKKCRRNMYMIYTIIRIIIFNYVLGAFSTIDSD